MLSKLTRLLGGAFFALLVLAPAALASSSPSKAGYGGAAGVLTRTTHPSGGLPFTGVDLTALVAGGVLLALLGVGLRRASRVRA